MKKGFQLEVTLLPLESSYLDKFCESKGRAFRYSSEFQLYIGQLENPQKGLQQQIQGETLQGIEMYLIVVIMK